MVFAKRRHVVTSVKCFLFLGRCSVVHGPENENENENENLSISILTHMSQCQCSQVTLNLFPEQRHGSVCRVIS